MGIEKVKSEILPYFVETIKDNSFVLGSGSVVFLNDSSTHYPSKQTKQIYASSVDYGVRRNFRIEPIKAQPEPIKAWVMPQHIAYFDPETSTYHIVSMMKSIEKQWLTTLVFNIMSIFT